MGSMKTFVLWFSVKTVVLWLLGVRCGEFGGSFAGRTRWCGKRFGHIDSCAYEFGQQPLFSERRRARGWR